MIISNGTLVAKKKKKNKRINILYIMPRNTMPSMIIA